MSPISVLLADDNLIVRAGVRMLLQLDSGIEVIGEAGDLEELIAQAEKLSPQVLVTDIRMPPTFADEGIEGAKFVRKRNPGTGVVVLSQFDDPEYVLSLLDEGSSGYAYLLKDRVADSDRLVRAIREVATGGSMLDPEIVSALVNPAKGADGLTREQQQLLQFVGEGKPVKAIAAAMRTTPEAIDAEVEELFLVLANDASSGGKLALRRLRSLHTSILKSEEQGETLSRLLPTHLADKLRNDPDARERTERLVVSVLMSDVRGYSGIAEHADPGALAQQLNEHRRQMNAAVLGQGGTVMQYVGDAVMAVFGAPEPQSDHASRAVHAALDMQRRQAELNEAWRHAGLPAFGLGIGISTGPVAAALLGSEERVEYTLVGDTVNLAQRVNDLARPAGTTVVTQATLDGGAQAWAWADWGEKQVKGRTAPVQVYALAAAESKNEETRDEHDNISNVVR